MTKAQPVDWLKKPALGYMMNSGFSDVNADILANLISEIDAEFSEAVFCMPKPSLHITLLDWIAPLTDYDGQDKDRLYETISGDYDRAMADILSSLGPIEVHFDEIVVSPNTIFVRGHDDGSFQKIREQFLEKVELLPGTKLPPQIIHSSLARFTKPIDLGKINAFMASKAVNIIETVTSFRLVRSTREPQLEFEVLKQYQLK